MKKAMKIILPLLLVFTIVGCAVWYLFVYDREFTRDMLLNQARYLEGLGDHEKAAWFYNRAYSHANSDEDVAIELSNQYRRNGNYTKAEYTLSSAIADRPSADLYIALSKLYVEQDKLLDAVNMLDTVVDDAIRAELDALRPAAPTASQEPGLYNQYITVEITVENGKLYVSNDGEYPSVQEDAYTEGFPLPQGETTIYALAVGDNGLVSSLSIFGYTIGGVIEPVVFADPAIEAQVREMLNVDADAVIYTNQLWEIEEFLMPYEATVYSDLAYMTHLKKLTIERGVSEQLSCLGSLKRLEAVDLYELSPTQDDLAIIAAIPTLKRLTLNNCQLSSIEPLSTASGLIYLDLTNNTIRNIGAITAMHDLQELYMSHNALTDLSALKGLSKLEKLDVSYNSLSSIAPICSVVSLKWLDVSNNLLSNLAAINNLTSLTYFSAAYNTLADVSPLAACTALEELDISNNALTDITALSALNAIQTFSFAHNQVTQLPQFSKECALVTIDGSYNLLTTLDELSGLAALNNVTMDYNAEITDVESLAQCHHLVLVNLFGTMVEDVSALTDMSVIVNYNPVLE